MTRRFKELKVMKNVEAIAISREENLCNVVINSDREVMPLNICPKKSKLETVKKPSLIISLTLSDN